MTILLYDGSFEGLLTSIFEIFEYKFDDAEIISSANYQQEDFFAEIHEVISQRKKHTAF